MKNQLIHLKQLLSGLGFFSLFIICCGFEVKADSINNSENNRLGNKKIKWVKFDGFKKNQDSEIKKVWERNTSPNQSPSIASTGVDEVEKKEIEKVDIQNADPNESPSIASTGVDEVEKKGIEKVDIQNADPNQSSSEIPLSEKKFTNTLLANKELEENKKNVIISEIIIQGWEDHPEGRKLELAAYDSMTIKPGSVINNQILKNDLNSIYASGWFSGVKIKSQDGPLGIKIIVSVVPNPILKKVELNPKNSIIPKKVVDDFFNNYYGTTLNLNELQNRIKLIKKWYEDKGYSLSRINGPERISAEGVISLNIDEGLVSDIELRFLDSDGEPIVNGKPKKGKTKDWVIKRELKTTPGSIFNRKILEADIKRLYATSLFDDVKVSLGPDSKNPGQVIIILDLSEQRTGSLTGGIGYSNGSGIFAQIGLQETNTLGRAWSSSFNLNFGEYATTYNISFFDPWIKGDKYKTSFKTNVYLSRDYPQEFRSEGNGRIYAVNDTTTASTDTLSSVVLEKTGGGFSFSRPMNGGDPFKETKWRVLAGMNFKKVEMIDSSGNIKPYGDTTPTTGNNNEIFCIGYTREDGSCPGTNTLVSVVGSTSWNNLNNKINPTSGNKFTIGSEQFFSVGENSPTFNRMRATYAFFYSDKIDKSY